ncbi:MAG TPA: SIS domain-containing protein [Ruminiclostridium sp.]|nr:SIS domain-containing protein [Ruminiclostridium sp.]
MNLTSMIEQFNRSLCSLSDEDIENTARYVLNTMKANSSIFICGNGGSGANANLFAAAMAKISGGTSIRIISLNANMPVITYAAESLNYDKVFSLQIENLAGPSDMLIAISGSGNSPNILEAVSTAARLGMHTIGLTGMGGGKLSSMVDYPVIVKSDNMEQIETIHTVIIHAISIWIAENLAGTYTR